MAGGRERRTKRRFDIGGANQDESGSSGTNVISGRELRPRERKRSATASIDDIVEESEHTSSDEDNVEDSPYRVEQRSGKAPAEESSSEEEEETAGDDEVEKEKDREESLIYPIIQRPIRLGSRKCVDYYGKGMTREVKRWRSIDPYPEPKNAVDPRFHTLFQQDFYESVILRDRKIAIEVQCVDWRSVEKTNDPLFQRIIDACESKHVKDLMGFQKDWNKELIAQFYATVHFGYLKNERAMFWMTEGNYYRVTFAQFVRVLGLDRHDANRPKIHNQVALPNEEMNFMYPRSETGNAGKATGLYTYYSILNRLLRNTISQRGGNPSDISLHARNLLACFGPNGEEFSVADYIWEEIKYISENPLKICAYAPYLMELIEKATKTTYQTDVKHESFRPKMPKHRREPSPHRYSEPEDDIVVEEEEGGQHAQQQQQPSPGGLTGTGLTGAQDRSDRSRPEQHRHRHGSTSPIKKLINLFVGMCKSQRDIEVEQQRQWRASKKERDSVKMMHNAMNLQPPRSPVSPSPPEAVIPSVEDRVQGYVDSGYFEQYGHIFYPDVSGPSQAPPPPPGEGVFGTYSGHFYEGEGPSHESSRPSAADQFATRLSDAVFGHHWDDHSSLGGNGGNGQ